MINVAFCIDDKFAPYAAVSVISILSNTKSFVKIYFIGNLSKGVREKLLTLKNDRSTMVFVAHNLPISTMPLSDRYVERLNKITFVRYAIAEVLTKLDKVIYLDADVLVRGDIKRLWEQPLKKSYVGAVLDHSLMSQKRHITLSLKSKSYFNAGVLLVDLKIWRDRGIFQYLSRTHNTRERWEYNDQDVLNVVLDEKVQYLGAEMNVQTYSLKHINIREPLIVHFTGQEKPWHTSSVHPYKDQYRVLLESVPFKNNKLSLYLDKEDRTILARLNAQFENGGNLIVWGAGARGRRIVKAIEQEFPAIVIKQVVDTYLIGKCFSYPIVSPENMTIEAIDAVVVATLPHKQDIRNLLRDKALTVI